jgi:hypothetical protein
MGSLVAAVVGAAAAVVLTSWCSDPGASVASSARSGTVEKPAPSVQAPASGPRRVELQVGHCYVEPVDFAGRWWGLRFSDQFGWGGPQHYPANWTGTGVLTQVAPDRVRYTDDGGAQLTLLPASSPAFARVEAVPCR